MGATRDHAVALDAGLPRAAWLSTKTAASPRLAHHVQWAAAVLECAGSVCCAEDGRCALEGWCFTAASLRLRCLAMIHETIHKKLFAEAQARALTPRLKKLWAMERRVERRIAELYSQGERC